MRNAILTALMMWAACSASAADISYQQIPFSLPAAAENLLIADMNADDLQDLVTVVDQSLRVYLQDQQGFNFESGFLEIAFDADAVGWDLSTGYSNSGQAAIIALLDGYKAKVWRIQGSRLSAPETVHANLPGFISKGVNRLHFSRDINKDGLEDLVIPGAGVINILVNNGNGEYQSPLTIRSDMLLRTQLNINRFNRSAGQAVNIPVIELRDLTGDGADDLVSRTDEKLDVFIADPSGATYFPSNPSISLDIAAIEERLGEFDIDNLDFSNLTGVLALTHEEVLDDVNNDGIEDLLLREGGKVSLFYGTGSGMDFDSPQQVLRSGGNVLSTFLYDENEDGLKDLWLWRVEPVSVGDIFVWLALSGSVAIEAFIYPNDGERFARRPARKITVDLRFPSVITLASAYEDLSSEVETLENAAPPPNATANLNENLASAELLLLVNNQIEIFLDSVEPATEDTEFLGSLGYTRQKNSYEINVRDIIDNVRISGSDNLQQIADKQADILIPLNTNVSTGDIFTSRINGDSIDDAFVFTHYDASQIQGILLLSN